MLATHLDAETRYTKLRIETLKAATVLIGTEISPTLKATEINPVALMASREWTTSSLRIKNWNWTEGYSSFKFQHPKRFEMALWDSNRLIGLSLGRPTYHGKSLRMDFIEASPPDLGDRPPIFEAMELAYRIYGRLINAKQLRIMNPANDKVRSYYETFGYQYVSKGDYLFMEII